MKILTNKWTVVAAFIAMFLFSAGQQYLDHRDDIDNNCKPTGEQRMTNSTIHASDSAFTALVVQDKWVCNGGEVKWKTPINGSN